MKSDEIIEAASQAVATRLNRRSFIRKGANRMFGVGMAVAVGKYALTQTPLVQTCDGPTGTGCPYGCGPSPCCNASGRSSSCKCGTGTNCKTGGNCHGAGHDTCTSSSHCWTCQYVECLPSGNVQFTNTCCDCKTSCGDYLGVCISYSSTAQVIGPCGGRPLRKRAGTILAVDTGDPATSLGDTAIFFQSSRARKVVK